MSEQNVQLHRRLIEAFNASDVEALRAIVDPSIEIHLFAEIGAIHHGHVEGLRWFEDLRDTWGDTFRIESEAYLTSASTRSCSMWCEGVGSTAERRSR